MTSTAVDHVFSPGMK